MMSEQKSLEAATSASKTRAWRDVIADSPLDALREEVLGDVASTDHRIDVSMYFRCFAGEEAVRALLQKGLAASQAEAEGICQRFVSRGVMRPVRGSQDKFQPEALYCYVGRKETSYTSPAALDSTADVSSGSDRTYSLSEFATDEMGRMRSETKEGTSSTDSVTCEDAMFDHPAEPPLAAFLGASGMCDDGDDEIMHGIRMLVMSVASPPRSLRGLRATHYFVRIRSLDSASLADCTLRETRAQRANEESAVMWMEYLSFGFDVDPSTPLEIALMVQHRRTPEEEMGRIEITLGELLAQPVCELVLCSREGDRVLAGAAAIDPVSVLRVSIDSSSLPRAWLGPRGSVVAPRAGPRPTACDGGPFERHLFIMTRGTRGDVQPFVALACALANNYNWRVTVCTELRYKSFIESHTANLERGAVKFCVSGGDTQRRVDSRLARWAIQRNSVSMQHLMMAYSEVEFFESEAAIFHHVRRLKPDYLMFGFTLAHVAMIVSEALQVPLLGLVLQPTCIPSVQYPPLHFGAAPAARGQNVVAMCRSMTNHLRHVSVTSLKILLENQPFTGGLARMRQDRGLKPLAHLSLRTMWDIFQGNTWMQLQEKKVPLIVPVNEIAFGGKPADWSASSTVLTNYILLRGPTVPDLEPDLRSFIDSARARKNKLVVLAFSSMPVQRTQILEVADALVSRCEHEISVVALMGDHAHRPEGLSTDCPEELRVLELAAQGRVLCLRGAPYDRLFDEMDAIVTHGGMGATAECLMAGVPVIVTGVLLFDQRFWGRRCHDLGIGPYPVHISDFGAVCVDIVDRAVAGDSPWRKAASDLAGRIKDSLRNDPSGASLNAACVHAKARYAPVFTHDGSRSTYKFYRDRKAQGSMRATILGADNFLVRALQRSVSTFYGVVHYGLYSATYVRSKIFRL